MIFPSPNFRICQRYKKDISHVLNSVMEFSKYPDHLENIVRDYFSNSYKFSGKISISIYFPYWLAENYTIERQIKKSIHIAGFYYSHYIRIQDFMIDKSENFQPYHIPDVIVVGNIFLMKSMEILRTIFHCKSNFWTLHDKHMLEYWNSIAWENKFSSSIKSWSSSDLERLRFKLAPLKICTAAFSYLAKDQTVLPSFEKLIDCYQIGMQLLDDIDDWKEDLANKRYTYFLSLIAPHLNPRSPNLSLSRLDSSIIRPVLNNIFTICINHFLESFHFANKLKLESMQEFLTLLIDAVINLKRTSEVKYQDILERGTSQFLVISKIYLDNNMT